MTELRRHRKVDSEPEIREYHCRPKLFERWKSVDREWWRDHADSSVWGRFANQAASGRYTFSRVKQPKYHFGETLVAWYLEKEDYVCWTGARIFRNPNRELGKRKAQTLLVDCLLQETTGTVPQREYEKRYHSKEALRLKSIDIVGFHFGHRHWIFCEVKRDGDRVHEQQMTALRFLRDLLPSTAATVCVAHVRETASRKRASLAG